MISLVLIGLPGGLITAVSPCILPVLPVVFLAGGPGGSADEGPPGGTTAPEGGRSGRASGGGAVPLPKESDGDVLAAGPPPSASPRNRRPYAVVVGLVLSFSFFTLLGVTIISALGLPDDILRYVGPALLVLIALGLIFPPVERLLEKPFARIPQRQVNKEGSAFALGLGLGLLMCRAPGPCRRPSPLRAPGVN
ncbi:hypothetical protein [Streptomyces sp. NPDC001068]|uniref:hypothetical protein n=1 Tax=Streptomyces sp. NPDC001068 TaxID=3364544 RepID=UPI00368660B3